MAECTVLDIVLGKRRCVEKLFVPLKFSFRCRKGLDDEYICTAHKA
jgi:hypothetical protein